MADSTLPNLVAVVTPAATDLFGVRQSGDTRDKKMTRAQVHALQSGEHLVLPQVDEVATPTLAFGDGDSGFYESADDTIDIGIAGVARWQLSSDNLLAVAVGGPAIFNTPTNGVTPIFAINNDGDTGIGSAGADKLSLIAGAVEALRLTSAGTGVIQSPAAKVGLTADVSSIQGGGVILSSYNVFTTVGTAGDAATLPAVFTPGTVIYIKNDAAANAMDIFPASGNDLGEGGDTALSLAAGESVTFLATAADSTWTKLIAPPAGVTQTGTNANNQIAHFTESGVITSNPGLTWDGSTLETVGITTIMGGDIKAGPAGAAMLDKTPTRTAPSLVPYTGDQDTGFGWEFADTMSIIIGGEVAVEFLENAGETTMAFGNSVGQTAHTGSSQGDGPITKQYNEYSTVANAGDAATLPLNFKVGTTLTVINNGANSMDVFPYANDYIDSLGQNVAYALAAGDSITFFATVQHSNWVTLVPPASGGADPLLLGDGDATNPSFGFTSDSESGLWSQGAGYVNLSVGGIEMLRVWNGDTDNFKSFNFSPTGTFGWRSNPTIAFGDGDSGFYEDSDDSLVVAIGTQNRWQFTNTYMGGYSSAGGAFIDTNGPSSALPSVVPYRNDANTGLGFKRFGQMQVWANADECARFMGGEGAEPCTYFNGIETDFVSSGVSNGTTTITKAGENFLTVAAVGNWLNIQRAQTTPADEGNYIITSVVSDTELTVDRALAGSDSNLEFNIMKEGGGFMKAGTKCYLALEASNDATAPTLRFGSGDAGMYQPAIGNISIAAGGAEALRAEDPADLAATETSLWLYDDDNGTMEQVTVGAADSGGTNFKVLRIPN